MHQSLRIVEQCLAHLEKRGPGPVNVLDPRVRWPAKGRVFNRMEELIQQFKAVTEGPRVPAGEAYAAVESANGELGFYVVSDGTGQPWKVRCRPPSLINLQPMPMMLRGAMLADLIPTFDFINMIGGECDR
jgi:NADH-quinone oxidoreductase subunit D